MSQFARTDTKNFTNSARANEHDQFCARDCNVGHSPGTQSRTFGLTKSDRSNKSMFGKSRMGQPYCPAESLTNFNKTSGKLFNLSFAHHDPNMCVCQYCNCGRHLCKFKNVKPDLSKCSVYRKSYDKKNPIPNNINISKQYDRLQGPNLDIDSNYRKNYDGKKGDPNQRPKPEDLLKSGGPCPNLTSYSSGFPGYRGANQYVKPTDNALRQNFPFMSRTTYSNAFGPRSTSKPKKQRINDNLKPGDLWLGKTTYGNFYKQPNPEDYAKKYKITEKLEDNPDYNHQYETTYKNSYLGDGPTVCPAKVAIETRSKGFFNSSKQKFAQNTDYKALNPAFHAISTSKHSYV